MWCYFFLRVAFFGASSGDECFQFRQSLFQFVHFYSLRLLCLIRTALAGTRNGWALRAIGWLGTFSLCEFEGTKWRSHRPVGVLGNLQHGLHILESAFLACLPRSNHHLPQHIERKAGIWRLGVLNDDLRQDKAGNVFACCRVDNSDTVAVLHHLGHFVEVHVAAVAGVVNAAVFVLLDEDRLWLHTGLHNAA